MRVVKLSLRWRVAVAFGLVSLVLTGALATVTWNLASGYMLRQREDSAVVQATVNVRLVEASLRAGSGGLRDLLAGLTTDSDSTVLLRRGDGWLTSGRQVDPESLPGPFMDFADGGLPARQRVVVDGVLVIAVTMPVATDGSAYVELYPLPQLDRTFRFLSGVLIAGVATSVLLGVTLGSWVARRALRPLTELTDAASRVAGGDLGSRLPASADPDLAPLASSFNDTADALERRVRRDIRFAGDVSHELRSPLTTMANAAAVLERRRDEFGGTARQALDLLTGEVDRFQRMVVDLLEISRDESDDVHPTETLDLGELVSAVVAVRPAPTPGVDRDGSPVFVQGDRRRLDRIIVNLLDNADHHGGGPVRIGVTRHAGRARVEVDDAGPGVPAHLREQVFERFTRGLRAGRRGDDVGTGLGLALVAQHVARHGGTVDVQDRPGGGARFVVELPEAT
ncbi:HAMP domain-containing sensor histidine kinase [Pseudonocardia abyssalis]|uniref:histidine kinase n=1 Tax=Pseudonocardia abyssalis TaxID=2792008 RepID=A0ABS6ULI2_9PSEU|nr:HAMP domain-containing sensor histidine kinase [Pseudonocardia abyssalis]MBW0118430.1 HAMP domain-containing histidine kinase [Pseudonocardia abyssalis]MBW0133117.1 HAMP domain-containing histidine kinase [Pseudonocardia abyssalis]